MNKPHYVYLRLIEKDDTDATLADRLAAVRRSIEKLGRIQWVLEPALHPRGGFRLSFHASEKPDYDAWLAKLESEGYMAVI